MNEEELRNKIETSIKTEKLNEYLLDCLKNECELNFLNLPFIITENALQRFEAKIKDCQQIEKDLPYDLILPGEYHLLSEKLDILKLKLAMLYANGKGSVIIEENYNEIKVFIFKILNLDIKLKLKYLDLTIKLLEKAIGDSQFNKEFIGALDLIKLFVNEPKYLPNEADLKYISDLGRQTNDDEIRKRFYGIIRELDKKLLLQDLLNQLLKIVKNTNGSPLMQFNVIFITKCLNTVCSLEAEDLNQVIGLVYRALEAYSASEITKKAYTVFKKIFTQKNLYMHLIEFAKDFKEKTSGQIINNPVRHDLSSIEKHAFTIYFPTHINDKRIRAKFAEAKLEYNETFKKNITTNDRLFERFREDLVKISSKTNGILENVKALASDAKERLEEAVETSSDIVTNFFKKNVVTSYQEENPRIDMNLSASLHLAKEEISPIKEKLHAWNSILNPTDQNNDNHCNYLEITQFDLNQSLELANNFTDAINEKFTGFIQQILDEFKKINDAVQKNSWFAKPEIGKSSFFHQIFHRGYFSGNYSIEKIKNYLKNDLSFATVNNLISKQSFWGLLRFGIIRWPWINKIIFAQNWAEQCCLTDVIKEIEKVKKTLTIGRDEEKILKEIISISSELSPYQSEIIDILEDFKRNIVIDLKQLETLEQKIDNCLNGKENSFFAFSPRLTEFFIHNKIPTSDNNINIVHARPVLRVR
ncbi:hypothetical protein [Rickettsiella endosymbiont of Miltochrista miniata]|uniref:hypothetical protein n=1 Tax=Rickettsiella endosymbiont of Miltochrista miniata TaxID=3066239 RepID=UPI00313C42A2